MTNKYIVPVEYRDGSFSNDDSTYYIECTYVDNIHTGIVSLFSNEPTNPIEKYLLWVIGLNRNEINLPAYAHLNVFYV